MRKYLKYILMGILAVTLSSIFFKKKTEAETSLPRDYAEIAASGILRAVTEYNSISFYADGDTVSGFHYELLHAFAHSKGLKPEITPEMSFSFSGLRCTSTCLFSIMGRVNNRESLYSVVTTVLLANISYVPFCTPSSLLEKLISGVISGFSPLLCAKAWSSS